MRHNSEEPKTVHMLRCRSCDGIHRANLKVTVLGKLAPEDMPDLPSEEEILSRSKFKCPKTQELFTTDPDDWEHLTEDEFHRLYPGNRGN